MRCCSIAWLWLPALRTQPAARAFLAAVLACLLSFGARPALGQGSEARLVVHPAPNLGELLGRTLTRVDVAASGGRWLSTPQLQSVHAGQPISVELVRRALDELADSGRYADLSCAIEADG